MVRSPSSVETEQKQLLAAIAHIDRNLAFPASREVSNALLTYRSSLLGKLEVLEQRQKALEEQEERTESMQRVAAMVERETALNSAEKEQYAGFLMKEAFTKNDFGALEQFYSRTYDRLTEEGKSEMSHRVWEGVRRDEYRFSELPETVKEKEAERLRGALGAGNKELEGIPEPDRKDFINTWDAGRKHDSYRVLDRPSFAKSVSVSAAVVPENVTTPQAVKTEVVKDEMNSKTGGAKAQAATPEVLGSLEFKDGDLAEASLKPPLSSNKKPSPVQGKG